MSTSFSINASHFDSKLLKVISRILMSGGLNENAESCIVSKNEPILFFSFSHVCSQFDGLDHATGIGDALTDDVEGRAVVRGGTDDG